MKDDIRKLKEFLKILKSVQREQQKRLTALDGCEKLTLEVRRNKKGTEYYSIRHRNRRREPDSASDKCKQRNQLRYLGKSSRKEVNNIKEAHYLEKSLANLANNIKLLEDVIHNWKSYDYEDVEQEIAKVYRGAIIIESRSENEKAKLWLEWANRQRNLYPVYRPEGLIHETHDGTLVRSKSEVIIYNLLLLLGYIFVYELPLKLGERIIHPDFTILSKFDYETIVIIEHQGMMDDPGYAETFAKRVKFYLDHGYVSGENILYTFDTAKVGISTGVIQDFLNLRVRKPA